MAEDTHDLPETKNRKTALWDLAKIVSTVNYFLVLLFGYYLLLDFFATALRGETADLSPTNRLVLYVFTSTFVVFLFRSLDRPTNIKIFGKDLAGSSADTVLWVIVFIAVSLSDVFAALSVVLADMV